MDDAASRSAERLGYGRGRFHIFLCAEQTKPKCASYEDTSVAWHHLKRRLKELRLEATVQLTAGLDPRTHACVHRNKVDCLRVCVDGPIAVVYPDGTWYGRVTPDVIDRILSEHITLGRPVQEYVLAVDPLGETGVLPTDATE